MIHYFLLLNKHKNLSLKRELDYTKNLIIKTILIIFSIFSLMLLFITSPKENFETFITFCLPAIISLDFSLRFFLKKNPSTAILPYLTLPIPRKTLILYIILSDLSHFWIWGCWLIYSIILTYYGILTIWSSILMLCFIFLNNYSIYFIKTLIGSYSLFIYPICLGFIFLMLFIVNLLNPVLAFTMLICTILFVGMALFFLLRENLYTELNRTAL